ncbi:MAG: hypothetical protein FWD87_01350 [Spirochaetaceae bacterium]|nr:hypothetical protein [Spirochaetaceae bacterium]
MKKQLLVIIIFATLIFGISSAEKGIFGTWETVVYDELVEMTFEKNTITVRIYGNDNVHGETAYFGKVGDFIVIDDGIYSYMLHDNRLLIIGDGAMFLLTRKIEPPFFTKDMLIGKWSAQRDGGVFEFLFDAGGTVTTTIYGDGELLETITAPYELSERHIKMDGVNYLFRASSDGSTLLLFRENMVLRKQ